MGGFLSGQNKASSDGLLGTVASQLKRYGMIMVLLSGAINILGITLSLFTMQVYDRVLSSRNLDSLVFLAFAASLALVTAATLDGVRNMTLNRIGEWLMQRLGPAVLSRSIERRMVDGKLQTEMVRELSQLRTFVSGPGVPAILDIPWMPVYLTVSFLIHPLLGMLSLVGMSTLFGLAWLNEKLNGPKLRQASALNAQVFRDSDAIMRNAEVIDSMGMAPQVVRRWSRSMAREVQLQEAVQQRNATLVSATRLTRSLLQIGLYTTAAILVLDQQLTGGSMMAASIVMSRLLSPMESMFVHWRSLLLIREINSHLKLFFALPALRSGETELPRPHGDVRVERVTLNMAGHPTPILRGVDFALKAGEHLAIVGPAASGKTTLSRIILGILRPTQGAARLDGMDVSVWRREDLGKHVGYLPQDVELFAGTVAQNIARFSRCPDAEIIRAARMAGCHHMIMGLPLGYDTEIGESGYLLSGGQRQQVGLARALFGRPRLIVLDEPNSNLDTQGERALKTAMERLHDAGVTVIVVTHRQALIGQVDKLLVLQGGVVKAFGPVDEVVGGLRRGADAGSGIERDTIVGRKEPALADNHEDSSDEDEPEEVAA